MNAYINAHNKIGVVIDALIPRDYTINIQTYFIINQFISDIINKNRCTIPPELTHMYIKGTINDKETEGFIEEHFPKCNQCIPTIRTIIVPPK